MTCIHCKALPRRGAVYLGAACCLMTECRTAPSGAGVCPHYMLCRTDSRHKVTSKTRAHIHQPRVGWNKQGTHAYVHICGARIQKIMVKLGTPWVGASPAQCMLGTPAILVKQMRCSADDWSAGAAATLAVTCCTTKYRKSHILVQYCIQTLTA
jgi:hypothetical protein